MRSSYRTAANKHHQNNNNNNNNTSEHEKEEDEEEISQIPPLRILICTSNMGNAQPDEESIAALLPKDGCVSDVVVCSPEKMRYPIDAQVLQQQQQQTRNVYPLHRVEEVDDVGVSGHSNASSVSSSGASKRAPPPQAPPTAPPPPAAAEETLLDFSNLEEEEEEKNTTTTNEKPPTQRGYFDIIVIGMQEANFNTLKKPRKSSQKEKEKKKKKSKYDIESIKEEVEDNPHHDTNNDNDDDDNDDDGYDTDNEEDYDDDDDDDNISTSSNSSTNSAPSEVVSSSSSSSLIRNPNNHHHPQTKQQQQPYAFDLLSLRSNSIETSTDREKTQNEIQKQEKIRQKKNNKGVVRPILKKALSKRTLGKQVVKSAGLVNENVVMPIMQTMYSCDHTKVSNNMNSFTNSSLYYAGGLPGAAGVLGGGIPSPTIILTNLVRERIGGDYEFLVNYQRGEMRLMILVRKGGGGSGVLEKEVEGVECDGVNTGIGNVLANKGGIIATFTLRKTRFTFLSAHLEAHEGEAHFLGRCSNLGEIFAGSRNGPGKLYDASITSHHMFVCGDLNYRVSLGRWDLDKYTHKDEVRHLVEEKDWGMLNEKDELRRALREKRCLAGFETLPCHFPPTFKVERKKGIVYQKKRSPSYTDRILWKSAHSLRNNVQPLAYEPVPAFSTSDHKPVRGAFSVIPNAPPPTPNQSKRLSFIKYKSKKAVRNSLRLRDLHFMVSAMKCSSLNTGSRTPTPYVLLVTDPPEMLKQEKPNNGIKILEGTVVKTMQTESIIEATKYRTWKGWPRSKSIENSIHPDWEGEAIKCAIQNLPDHDEVQMASHLAGAMLYITIMNDEIATADTVIGTVALNMEKLLSDDFMRNVSVFEPILRDGKVKGMLECNITTMWMSRRGLC